MYLVISFADNEQCLSTLQALFIPRGWWHMCTNLVETLAITQNYVGESFLSHVLDYIDSDCYEAIEDRISGIDRKYRCLLYNKFVERLEEYKPKLVLGAQQARKKRKVSKIKPNERQEEKPLKSSYDDETTVFKFNFL